MRIKFMLLVLMILVVPSVLSATIVERTEGINADFVTLKVVLSSSDSVKIVYGPAGDRSAFTLSKNAAKIHDFVLSNLDSNTRYYYQVVVGSTPYPSGSYYNFKTLDSIGPHKLSSLAGVSSSDGVSLAWDVSLDSDTAKYNVYRNGILVGSPVSNSYVDTGLSSGTSYVYTVSSVDVTGAESVKSDGLTIQTKEVDVTAPVISSIDLLSSGSDKAVISFKTNEVASVKIIYGKTSGSLTFSASNPNFRTEHILTMAELDVGSTYYYRIEACDGSSNCGSSAELTFVAGTDTTAPTIDISLPLVHNDKLLTVSGKTEPFSTIFLKVNSKVSSFSNTGLDGLFTFIIKDLVNGNNIVRFEATDLGGNGFARDFTVKVDTSRPKLDVTMPTVSSTSFVNVNGSVLKQSYVFYQVEVDGVVVNGSKQSVSGSFSLSVPVNEGTNIVRVFAVDDFGNSDVVSEEVLVDTKKPVILSPTTLAEYNPTFSPALRINGQVDTPFAVVVATVNDRVSPAGIVPTSLTGLFEHFTRESKYVAQADAEGKFSLDLELERKVFHESDLTGEKASLSDVTNSIKITAFSRTGLASDTVEGNIDYAVCGEGGIFAVTYTNPTPTVVSPDMFRRGLSQFGMTFELKYNGNGDPSKAVVKTKPRVTKQAISTAEENRRNSYWLANSPSRNTWSSDYRAGSILWNINQFTGTDEEFDERFGSTKSGYFNIFKFPVIIEFEYEFQSVSGDLISGTQKQCIDLGMPLDVELLPKKIPRNMLENGVELFSSAIGAINNTLEIVAPLQEVAFWGCMATWGYQFVQDVKEKLTCIPGIRENALVTVAQSEGITDVVGVGCEGSADPTKCGLCAESIKTKRSAAKISRNVCDRTFCRQAPNLDEHARTYVSEFKPVLLGKVSSACDPTIRSSSSDSCKAEYEEFWDSSCFADEYALASTPPGARSSFENLFNPAAAICQPTSTDDRAFNTGDGVVIVKDGKYYQGRQKDLDGLENVGDGTYRRVLVDDYVANTDKELKFKYGADGNPATYTVGDSNKEIEINNELKNEIAPIPKYVTDPTGGLLSSVQCACLPAFNSYLNIKKQQLDALRQCSQKMLLTNKLDPGLCKAVFTQFVCDAIINTIDCVGQRLGVGKVNAGTVDTISGGNNFFSALSAASTSMSQQISNTYGSGTMFNAMFSKRKLIHSVCLGAFTGDWDFDVQGLLQGSFRQPVESEAFIPVSTRKFITSDPTKGGIATHLYHIAYGISAGSDVNYNLELICSSDNSCPENAGGRCDCSYGNADSNDRVRFVDGGNLKQGELFGVNNDDADQYFTIESRIRYDKAALTVTPLVTDGVPVTLKTVRVQVPLADFGSAPSECKFSQAELMFTCGSYIARTGDAKFIETPSLKKEYYVGDKIDLNFELLKKSPGYDSAKETTDPDKLVTAFVKVGIKSATGRVVKLATDTTERHFPLIKDGTWVNGDEGEEKRQYQLPHYEIQPLDLGVARLEGDIKLSGMDKVDEIISVTGAPSSSDVDFDIVLTNDNKIKLGEEVYPIEKGIIRPYLGFRVTVIDPSKIKFDDTHKQYIIKAHYTAPTYVSKICSEKPDYKETWTMTVSLVQPDEVEKNKPSNIVYQSAGRLQEYRLSFDVFCEKAADVASDTNVKPSFVDTSIDVNKIIPKIEETKVQDDPATIELKLKIAELQKVADQYKTEVEPFRTKFGTVEQNNIVMVDDWLEKDELYREDIANEDNKKAAGQAYIFAFLNIDSKLVRDWFEAEKKLSDAKLELINMEKK